MKFHNPVQLQGILSIVARDVRTGEEVRTITIKNVITFDAIAALVELISQNAGTPAQNQVTLLEVGEGTDPADRSQTDLAIPVGASIPLTATERIENTVDGWVEIQATLPALPAINKTLSEAALKTTGGRMFARQTHPGILHDGTIALDYTWRIVFTA